MNEMQATQILKHCASSVLKGLGREGESSEAAVRKFCFKVLDFMSAGEIPVRMLSLVKSLEAQYLAFKDEPERRKMSSTAILNEVLFLAEVNLNDARLYLNSGEFIGSPLVQNEPPRL